jgi:predicted TIM-barrel fold metal-dependent hydrolase
LPVPGQPFDDILLPYLEAARAFLPPGTRWTDIHTHTGFNDPDGVTGSAEELLAALDRAGHDRAVTFTTAEPDGYPAANDRVLAECAASGGRLVAFCRIDPNAGDPIPEIERCLALGARGVKLHPRSDAFQLPHPEVERIVAFAAERRMPVLFHAGRGIPALGAEVNRLAGAYPGARLILAHAGISDLGLLGPHLRELPNVFFDTAWWQVSDMLALFDVAPPGQILYASDMPYGSGRFAALNMLRCTRQVGLAPEAVAVIAGAQAERLIAWEDTLDAGPPPGDDAVGHRWLAGERILAYAAGAAMVGFRGGDATEAIALARLACQVPTGGAESDESALLAVCDELLARAQEWLVDAPEGPPRGRLLPVIAAQLVAGTPRAAV